MSYIVKTKEKNKKSTSPITVQSAICKRVEEPILKRFELRREKLRARYAADRCHRCGTVLLLLLLDDAVADADRCVRTRST